MLRAGERIGPLRIERPLGIGGMGEVYLARDERLERHVAVKLLPEGRRVDPNARGRMLREARAASALKHPSIVTIHDVGEHDGRSYIVMEYVDGETFGDLIERRGALPAAEAVGLVAQAADAVAAAHAAGVLHRDIKSANLMIDGTGRVMVLDFGLSKRTEVGPLTPVPGTLRAVDPDASTVDPDPFADELSDVANAPTVAPRGDTPARAVTQGSDRGDEPQTMHGARMGTPGWAPPELIDGRKADVRSDVFSLGCVLYHLLAGTPPFTGTDWTSLREQIDRGPPAPSQRVPGVPVALDQVVLGALAVDPAKRPQTATALIDAARAALPRARPRRTFAIAGALGVAAIAAVGAGVFAIVQLAGSHGGARGTGHADAAASPVPAPVQITHLGGCAYSPAFLDEDTLVFDLTRDNAVDLYRLELGAAAPVQLTTDPGWEWRSSRGASDREVVFIRQGPSTVGIDALDLVTGARRVLSGEAGAVTFARDAYYYSPTDGGQLRRIRGERDDVFVAVPPGRLVDTITASPDGRHLAMILLAETIAPALCTVDLDDPAVRCQQTLATASRPAFSSDGRHVYYEHTGVWRVGLDDGAADAVLPGVSAGGGIAVSPSGTSMVFSDCRGRTLLVDTLDDPSKPIVDDPSAHYPAFGRGGVLVYVRVELGRQILVLRDPGGASRELLARDNVHFSDLALSPDGERLAFVLGDASAPGIYLGAVHSTAPPNPLTQDASDIAPVFVGDQVYFTRRAADGAPQLMRVGLDGSGATVASPRPRLSVGADPSGRMLLAAPGRDFLYWWDPRTGVETPGPVLPPGGPPGDFALSPDGGWVVIVEGPSGQTIWRVATAPGAHPEPVGQLRGDQSALTAAIDDRGHPLVGVDVWKGELWRVAAPAGAPW